MVEDRATDACTRCPEDGSTPAKVFSGDVDGLVPSPLAAEDFSKVTIEG